jgi:hypothetical protein
VASPGLLAATQKQSGPRRHASALTQFKVLCFSRCTPLGWPHGQPFAYALMKHEKSSMFSTGSTVEPSQFA